MTSSESIFFKCKNIKNVLSDDITAFFWWVITLSGSKCVGSGSASGLNQSWMSKKQKQKNKTGFYSENSAPTGLNSVLIPLKTKSDIRSRCICNHWGLQMAKLFSDRQLEAQVYRIRGSRTCFGCQRRRVHYSTSLGLSVLSFLMTGRGWASVLKTQWSNGRWSSSEKSR